MGILLNSLCGNSRILELWGLHMLYSTRNRLWWWKGKKKGVRICQKSAEFWEEMGRGQWKAWVSWGHWEGWQVCARLARTWSSKFMWCKRSASSEEGKKSSERQYTFCSSTVAVVAILWCSEDEALNYPGANKLLLPVLHLHPSHQSCHIFQRG